MEKHNICIVINQQAGKNGKHQLLTTTIDEVPEENAKDLQLQFYRALCTGVADVILANLCDGKITEAERYATIAHKLIESRIHEIFNEALAEKMSKKA